MSLLVPVATVLIKKVASSYLSKITSGSSVTSDLAENVLTRLANFGLLKLPKVGEVTDDILSSIRSGLGLFQKQTGLPQTDFLDAETAKWALDCCDGSKQNEPKVNPSGDQNSAFKMRYFVEPGSLPTLTGGEDADKLLDSAFVAWARYFEIDFRRVSSRAESNILIHAGDMDGPGGALADASVGPPDEFENDLKFDSSERSWDSTKFRYTCVHEIGHVLGLEHTNEPSQIMSVVRQRDIRNPTKADVERLKGLGYYTFKEYPEAILGNDVTEEEARGLMG